MTTNPHTVPREQFEEEILPSSAKRILPELTLKSLLFGFFLAVVLCASNIFVALKVGRTISGSIPAAVLSILFLNLWRKTSILEHNIVQTTASAGEVVSCAVSITIPALVMIGYWDHFHYIEVLSIAIVGGFLGVAFSVPLRRSMIVQQNLPYPEGIAAAEILKSSEHSNGGKMLLSGGLFASIISFFQDGAKWFATEIQVWTKFGTLPFGTGLEFSPILVGAGYIVGLRISAAMVVGTVITWCIAIPLYAYLYGAPEGLTAQAAAIELWKTKLRFMGVGAMVIAGLWGMLSLSRTMFDAIRSSVATLKGESVDMASLPSTERDMPMNYVAMIVLALTVPLMVMFYNVLVLPFDLSFTYGIVVTLTAVVASLVIAFGCAAVGSYLTGVVGSTLLPISGITIAGILLFGGLLFALLGNHVNLSVDSPHALSLAGATILFACIVALSAYISGDNMQDLKTGKLVGATPWKQQFVLLVGVVGGAIIAGPILELLYNAYGFGDVMPRAGMDAAHTLKAPQATMMAAMARGLFSGGIEWNMIFIGVAIAVGVICVDQYFKSKGRANSLPVLTVALGMYMPASLILTFLIGGIIAHYADKTRAKMPKDKQAHSAQGGILYASGIIAGTSLIGVLIAIPLAQGFDMSAYIPRLPSLLVHVGGLGMFGMLIYSIYQKATVR